MSIQADKAGYACSPRQSLDTLEEYDAVEVALCGPFPHVVDVMTLELPLSITSKFPDIENGHPCIGLNLNWQEVAILEAAVAAAAETPGAGIPRGNVGWSETEIYVAADEDLARDILELGPAVMAGRSVPLFLDNREAALHGAEVLRMTICEAPRVLDLRNAEDRNSWIQAGLSEVDDVRPAAIKVGIDGIYMPEDGCLMLHSPKMIRGCAYRITSNVVDQARLIP